MKRFWYGVAISLVAIVVLAGFRSGDLRMDTVIASAVDADGTVATVTLSEPSFDCTFRNLDTTFTNTLDITINAGSNKIRLYGLDSYNTQQGDVPIVITSFASDAVVGTPDVQYFCWGQ
jgi:hypothetical protein